MSEDFINVIADNLFANTSQKELSAERIYEVAESIAPFVITAAKKELMKDLPKWKYICTFQSFTDNDIFIEDNCLRWGNRVIALDELKKLPKED